MQVRVLHEDTTTIEIDCIELRDIFDAEYGGEDYAEAADEIERNGRYWLGGGSAPLFYIVPLR